MTGHAWLIESDPLFRAFLEQELERRDWAVLRSEDGVKALSHVAEARAGSVILLGASLTLVSSMHVMRAIRAEPKFADAVIFYLSNRFDPAIDYAAKQMAARVVHKPIDFANLVSQLTGVVRRGNS